MFLKKLTTFLPFPIAISAAISYNVDFEEIQDIRLLKAVKSASQAPTRKKDDL